MNGPATRGEPDDDFSSLFEFLPIGAYRSTPEGRQLRANPALVRLNGFASEQDQVATLVDIARRWYVDPSRRAQFMRLLERDGHLAGFESEVWRYQTRERIWVSENAHTVRDAQGRMLYYEGTVEEITERVAARQALARSQDELRQIVDLVPGMVYRVVILPGGQRRATFVSPGVRALLGLDPDEVLRDGMLMHRLRHVEDRPLIDAATAAAARTRTPLQLEYRMQLLNGQVKWVHAVSAAAPTEDGHEVRVGMVFDISARKEAEAALQQNSQLWKRALESTGDGVWDWHVQDDVEVFSPQCRALYGYDAHELPDRAGALDALTHPDDLGRLRSDRQAHLQGRTSSFVNEHRVRCKDGQWKWILSRGIVISRDGQGAALRMIGTHTDITADRQADALRHERDRAAAADLAKSQLLSRVSHELRTPLNAILGFAQLLELSPGAGARQLEWIRQVLASGAHLLSLVDDVLELSSAQTGLRTVCCTPVTLRAVVEEAWAMLATTAASQQVTLFDELPPGAACQVLADRKRLKQVVSNLLSNAVKYNRPGGWVRVSVLQREGRIELQVADSASGLDAAQQARLFKPFDRLGAEHGPVAGTGLGLALSRQLAEAMSGTITVSSRLGVGSTFSLDLPAA